MKNLLAVLALAAMATFSRAANPVLTPNAPIELTGTKGKFDFIKIDPDSRRLLACHTGNGTLDVIDLDSGKLIKSVPTGAAQGVAIDEKGSRYFVSCSKPPQLAIVDSAKLEVTATIPLPSPADLVACSVVLNRVFVDNDEKPEMWVIDPEAKKILNTITFPGAGMEDIGFNFDGVFLYQNLKETSELVQVDPGAAKITGKWTTIPADKPHGFAMLNGNAVLIAGGAGHLALFDLDANKEVASCGIELKVDEIAYDPILGRAYCASGTGVINVIYVSPTQLSPAGDVPSTPGTHSIAVDPKTHTVWIAYAKDNKPYVQSFTAK